MVHAGNHLGIAERGGQVVGATLAFRAADAAGPTVHSHLAAVAPDTRTRHIGYALKQQQRAWALAQGIPRMTWTYDPLVARNGYFNLAKLGATAVSYYPDFYGVMADRMNVGTASDRCLVEWRLAEARARNAADGRPQLIDVVALRNADTPVLLWVGPDGQPVSPDSERTWHSSPSALLAQVPADIVALRDDDPALAAHWRSALADVLGRAFATGHHLIGADRGGWHLLGRT
jgi:predicted GNAT superfamily acetyltransferase